MSTAALRQSIAKSLDIEELRTLCFDLGIDYDSLRGEGKVAKIRELIAYLKRDNRLAILEPKLREMRPLTDWQTLIEQASSAELETPEFRSAAEDASYDVATKTAKVSTPSVTPPQIITLIDAATEVAAIRERFDAFYEQLTPRVGSLEDYFSLWTEIETCCSEVHRLLDLHRSRPFCLELGNRVADLLDASRALDNALSEAVISGAYDLDDVPGLAETAEDVADALRSLEYSLRRTI